MKRILLSLLLVTTLSSYAQYTLIPDLNFEKALIAQNIDSGVPDGKVLTSSINTLTDLTVPYGFIVSLTGIEDFVALQKLSCNNNQLVTLNISKNINLTDLDCQSNQLISIDLTKNINLTVLDCQSNQLISVDLTKNINLTVLHCESNLLNNLDVSKNSILTNLYCGSNKLTSLDVSLNISLIILYCDSNQLTSMNISKNINLTTFFSDKNQLTSMDLTKNIALTIFACSYNKLNTIDVAVNINLKLISCFTNQLKSLDVSKNINLINLYCGSNQLTSLNLKNGNNPKIKKEFSDFRDNPNLTCIQVDNANYSNSNWASLKDATATYSNNCPGLGLAENVFETVSVYPNPTQNILHIDNITLDNATVYDTLGCKVQTVSFDNAQNNTLDLSGLAKGTYYVYLLHDGVTEVRKVGVE
jgi:hypothetical protein